MNNQQDTLQQIADRIIQSASYSTFYDNLTEIEFFKSKQRDNLILHFKSFVSISMLKDIEAELGIDMNMVFHNMEDVTVYVPLDKVIIR
ncbi:hypothetical protein [Serratia sp. (in: enterobacteria)]|uniref:hypothetical protein n=1 Tax=Serratia sp. (in: enterobacteria) TaxID=616 RepID=UPI003988A92C